MKKLLHFFSVAVLTQLVLMLSQLVLLPMQIRIWGHQATAQWYAALALATITSVVDCGLRTAGHTELLEHVKGRLNVSPAGDQFLQIWSWIRLMMAAMTVILIAGQGTYTVFVEHSSYQPWKIAIILAYSLETLLAIRITYLDTLGFYRGAEASYLIFAALRLLLSVPAILIFHFQATGLACLFLLTSGAAVAIQGFLLCRNLDSLKLFTALPARLSLKVLLVARLTVAEPFATWVRLNLPIVVMAVIAPPSAVTTFVGLRAAFGAARTTIQQLARVASVEYLRFRSDGRAKQAGTLLLLFILVASLVGTSAAAAVIADNMRLMGMWLTRIDRSLFQTVAIAFVLSAPFYAYQIPLNLMFRAGELAWVARRHYFYAAYSCLFGLCALQMKNFILYLGMLVCSEIALSVSFMLAGKRSTATFPADAHRGLLFCAGGSFLALLLWLIARFNLLLFLRANSRIAAVETIAFGAACLAVLAFGEYAANPQVVLLARPFVLKSAPVQLTEEHIS